MEMIICCSSTHRCQRPVRHIMISPLFLASQNALLFAQLAFPSIHTPPTIASRPHFHSVDDETYLEYSLTKTFSDELKKDEAALCLCNPQFPSSLVGILSLAEIACRSCKENQIEIEIGNVANYCIHLNAPLQFSALVISNGFHTLTTSSPFGTDVPLR